MHTDMFLNNLPLKPEHNVVVPCAYLDLCCYGRPFDQPFLPQLEREISAVWTILQMIQQHKVKLVWSYVLDIEVAQIPDIHIKNAIADWQNYATINVNKSLVVDAIAQLIQLTGVHKNDALHVACAKVAQSQFFVTTDKRLLKYKDNNIILCNPVDFLTML